MPDIFIAEPNNDVPPTPPREDSILEQRAKSKQKLFSEEESLSSAKNPVHLFSAFKKNPDGITFRDQEEGEKILLFVRRSFITNLKWILLGTFLAILPVFLPLLLQSFQSSLLFFPAKFYLMLGLFYYLFVAIYWHINFITWYFNIDLVTNKRIIDINFSNLVYKDIATTELSFVHDVSFSQVGAIRTFFDYGTVLIQIPGATDAFIFESTPQPENAVQILDNLIRKENEPTS